jgi:predicted nucleic acid-binding protein
MLTGVDPPLDGAVVLLKHVIQMRHWPMPAILGQIAFGFELRNGGRMADKTVVPSSVRAELLNDAAPANVRAWAANPPVWVEIHVAKQVVGTGDISRTDREAIALARELNASFLLMDDQQARRCASALEVITLGTLGLLEAAAARGLVSLPAAIEKLRRTSFFVTDELIEAALQRDTERRRRQPT